ncbi:MAG TPA: DMT family transporter [Casimicrobiaceae bacterium]|nr:DMT family transporter [Casimicrobiaceae bacterium]
MIGYVLAVAALAGFSANIMLARLGSARLPMNTGYVITVTVNIAFAALLFCVELAIRSGPLRWNAWGFFLFALSGFFATYLGRWLVYESIVRLGPAKASAFQVSSPLFTFLIALVFLGERLSVIALGGMLLTAAGLLLVSLQGARTKPSTATTDAPRARRWLRSGLLLGAGSSAAYAVGNVMRGAGVREWNEPIAGALIGAGAGFAVHLVLGSGHLELARSLRHANRRGIALFAASGVITIGAQMCAIAAMRFAPVSVVALITLCTPVFVFPLSYFFLHNDEGISVRTAVGAVLTLAGIAMIVLK